MVDNSAKKIVENITSIQLSDALSTRYLSYAMSTIMSRSLPDVRDGLKPVHRRLLFAMRELKLDPKSGYKKSARVVGDVIGKYHPHGDASVYDAMVRLSQSFAVRYPLVEGQGNFGNIDGDSAAAMRYTEARLTDVAICLMEGLDSDAVDFTPNYDGSEDEPILMPALFPNLLCNGAMGIAVGMATNIPPHNLVEVCDATLALIKDPNINISEIMQYIKGPDFPTGGVICENKQTIVDAYEKGRGSLTIRAKWTVEELQYGNYQIVITDIPYQVQKSKLIEKIAELLTSGKLPLIGDIRDETTDKIRIIIEPKSRTIAADKIMISLFALTDLEIKFSMNMNVLDSFGIPRVLSIKEILQSYIDHRKNVIKRQAQFRISKIDHRLEILGGYLIAYLNLDRVIDIIRNNDEPKELLIKEFDLSELQVEAILNMKLKSLRKLEEMEIKKEDKQLRSEKSKLLKMISTDENLIQKIAEDTENLKLRFGTNYSGGIGKRLTKIDTKAEATKYDENEFIVKENVTVILSEKGWIKVMKGHIDQKTITGFKENDFLKTSLYCQNTDKLIIITDNGKCFNKNISDLPSGRGYGEPITLLIEIGNSKIVNIFNYNDDMKRNSAVIASSNGFGFKFKMDNLLTSTKNGKTLMNLSDNDKVIKVCVATNGEDMIATLSTLKMMLIFSISEIPEMTKGKGVILQKYNDKKTHLKDFTLFSKADGLNFIKHGKVINKATSEIKSLISKRANVGKLQFDDFPANGFFA